MCPFFHMSFGDLSPHFSSEHTQAHGPSGHRVSTPLALLEAARLFPQCSHLGLPADCAQSSGSSIFAPALNIIVIPFNPSHFQGCGPVETLVDTKQGENKRCSVSETEQENQEDHEGETEGNKGR